MTERQLDRPHTQRRQREFGRMRESKSQRAYPYGSRFDAQGRNMAASFIKKLDYDAPSKKPAIADNNNKQNTSKQTQQLHSKSYSDFGQTHSRRGRSRLDKSSKLLCVGCYNKQLITHQQHDHKQDEQHQKQLNNLSLINEDDAFHKRARRNFNHEYEKAKQYNLMMIERHREEKSREIKNRQIQSEETRQISQANNNYRQKQTDWAVKRKQELRKDLEEQIRTRRLKQMKEQQEIQAENKTQQLPFFGNVQGDREKIRQKSQDDYRKELMNQIEEHKEKQKHQAQVEVQRLREQELTLMQEAVQKEKKRKEQENKCKSILAEEARIRKQNEVREQERIYLKKKQEEKEKKIALEKEHEEMIRRENKRRSQIDSYLSDLKKQMNHNKQRKQEEYNYLHEPTSSILIKEKRKGLERECDSCEKRYPQIYLTRVAATDNQ